jgi:hypothetical protein
MVTDAESDFRGQRLLEEMVIAVPPELHPIVALHRRDAVLTRFHRTAQS